MKPTLPVLLCATLLLGACQRTDPDVFPGYAEGEYVRLASPIAGTLAKLHLRRGDRVAAGAPAFVLEQDSEQAARNEAAARLARAQAVLDNLKKGRRPDELAALQAQAARAQAALDLSLANLARQQQLVSARYVSPARLDEANSAVSRDRAQVRELQAQLRIARQGARADEIRAAEQEVAAAVAQVAQADWRVARKTLNVPAAADVADVLYREGELVPAGAPVVSLLPPGNVKARFFVPEAALGRIRLGQPVTIACDGCPAPLPATISYIAPQAEYTSPQIYSKENRASLVFMVEARSAAQEGKADNAARLHPGQPLEIRLAGSAR